MQTIALRLLACCMAACFAWSALGAQGLVWCAPLFGIALAGPVFNAIAGAWAWLRALAYRDVEGRHYAFKGVSISVAEDDQGRMWLRLSDVRKVLPWLVGDEALRRVLGADVEAVLPDRAMRVQAEALLTYLERAALPDSVKFKNWVARSVVFPSKQRTARGRN
jgi:hypothetical protein